jgi:hypothetical protein
VTNTLSVQELREWIPFTTVSDRDPTIRDYFQRTESDLTRSSSQRLGGIRKAKAFPLGLGVSVIEATRK